MTRESLQMQLVILNVRNAWVLTQVLLLLLVIAATTSEANPVRFSADHELVIGANENFKPIEYINSKGVPDGYTIDLVKALAEVEGLNITLKLDAWHSIMAQLKAGELDAVTGMMYSQERDKIFDFSIPYLNISYVFFQRGETQIDSLEDARGKEIIVVDGVYAHEWLTQEQITDTIVAVNTPEEAMQLLAAGNHDYVLMPRLHGLTILEDLGITDIETTGPPLLVSKFSFAVPKGNSALLAELNEGLYELQESGKYDEIYLKWLSVSKYSQLFSNLKKLATITLLTVGCLVLLIVLWNWQLKREVRRKTDELLQNELRLRQIIEGVPVPTFVVNKNRTVTHWNKACELLTSKSAEKIVGTDQYPSALHPERTYSMVDLLLDSVLTERIHVHDQATYRASSIVQGAYETEQFFAHLGVEGKWLFGACVLLKDESGAITGAIETWQDFTESRDMEKQLIQSQKMEALGTLAGGLAHDFNNILTAVYGHAEIALDHAPDDSPVKERLKRIIGAATRAQHLVDKLLNFSRQAEVEVEHVQVSAVVEETVELFRASLPKNVSIQLNLQTNAKVYADATHIHQIVMNLCTNAGHATASLGGTIDISLTEVLVDATMLHATSDAVPGTYILLEVSDTGAGIPAEMHDKILDPFFTLKKKEEGTGLGLSVTHGIIKQYSGMLAFDSTVGEGSNFRVYLPIA